MKQHTMSVNACVRCPSYNKDTFSCKQVVDQYHQPESKPVEYGRRVIIASGIPGWCPLPDTKA